MVVAVLIALAPNVNYSVNGAVTTFGLTTVGSTMIGTGGGAAKTGGQFQLTTSGSVTKLTAYIKGYGVAKAAIYSDLNGQPYNPIGGATMQAAVPSSAGWVDFVYASPVSLQAGTYWLTLIYDSGCNWFFSYGGVSAWNWITASYANQPSIPFGSHTDRADKISIYATVSTGTVNSPTPTQAPSAGFFGYASVGSSMIGTGGGAAKTGGRFLLTSVASVAKLTAYVKGYGVAKAAIYSDLNGQPNVPIGGATLQVSVPSSASWVDFNYPSPVSLQPGYYWLTLVYDSGCNWFYNSGGASAWNWLSYPATYVSQPSSPFGSHTDRTDIISIYATFSGGSASNPAPTPAPTLTSASTVKLGIYTDQACTNKATSITWGALTIGTTKQLVLYVRNEGNSPMTLVKTLSNFNPSTLSSYLSLSWDYGNNQIAVGAILKLTLTLTVASNTPTMSSFGFATTITAT